MRTVYTARPAAKQHPAVIIFADDGKRIADRLAAEGWRGVVVDPGEISSASLDRDLDAALAALRDDRDVSGDRIGCLGVGVGGHVAFLAAARTSVRATVCLDPVRLASENLAGGEPALHEAARIEGRILCLYGRDPGDVDAVRAAVGTRGEVVVLHGAGKALVDDAWPRIVRLFTTSL